MTRPRYAAAAVDDDRANGRPRRGRASEWCTVAKGIPPSARDGSPAIGAAVAAAVVAAAAAAAGAAGASLCCSTSSCRSSTARGYNWLSGWSVAGRSSWRTSPGSPIRRGSSDEDRCSCL